MLPDTGSARGDVENRCGFGHSEPVHSRELDYAAQRLREACDEVQQSPRFLFRGHALNDPVDGVIVQQPAAMEASRRRVLAGTRLPVVRDDVASDARQPGTWRAEVPAVALDRADRAQEDVRG